MVEFSVKIDFHSFYKKIGLGMQNAKFWHVVLKIITDSFNTDSNEEFLSKVHANLAEIIDVSNFFVALYQPKTKKYTFPFFIDEKDEKQIFLDLDLSRSLTDFVRRKEKAILIDKEDDTKLIESGEVDLFGQMSEYWLGIPLYMGGKSSGVLVLQSYSPQIYINEEDLLKMIFITNLISLVLEHNNFLYHLKENVRHFHIAQEVSDFGSFEIDVYNDTWWLSDKIFKILRINNENYEDSFLPLHRWLKKYSKVNFDEIFIKFVQELNEIDFELEWQTRYKEFKIVRIRAEKFYLNNGRVLKINGIIQDITEQRNYEIKLEEAKEKAEESERLKTAFLSNISHEVRTPMNAIIGFSDLLTEPDITKEETAEYVKLITTSGQVLIKLIDDIVDIAKIETGQLSLNISRAYVNRIFKELFNYFEVIKKEKSKEYLKIIFESDFSDPDFYFYTDEVRLRQIITNFISNAIKFTEKGYIKCSCLEKNKFIEFRIEDTGIGISDENRSIIFKQFGQILNEGRIYQGTGLGLTISRNLIKMMGGEINFTSEVGKGTTFYFSLPFEKEKSE